MKIAFLGDIAFMGKYSLEFNKNAKDQFSQVSELLSGYDHVIGNLELPFTNSKNKFSSKSVHLKSSPINTELLKFLNVDIVNLANNHIYDYGRVGVDDTITSLDDIGIDYFGVFDKDFFIKDSSNQIVLHGYCCYSSNPVGVPAVVNELDVSSIVSKLKQYHDSGLFNILSLHFGIEHVNCPSVDHILMAKRFKTICPYFLYGHHPHVIQGIEKESDALYAYSLGNFCFDDIYKWDANKPFVSLSDNNKSAIIIGVEFENNRIVNYETIPIYLDDNLIRVNVQELRSKLNEYSSQLSMYKVAYYQEERNKIISKYISDRKSKRDLSWYFKRMNFDSIKSIYASRHNSSMYRQKVTNNVR